jgi:hypothetical protein
LRRLVLALLMVAGLVLPALADDSRIVNAEIVPGEAGGYVINADIAFELNDRLQDALLHGVTLYFVAEAIVERPRWYWLNEVVVDRRLEYGVSYHAITRSYRLSIGSFHQSVDSLDAAVRTMQRIRNWQVAEAGDIRPGISHEVALRFRLDMSQLPKPFQVTAIGSRDWNLGTEWMKWTFLPGAPAFR